jgi:hypothetical protein
MGPLRVWEDVLEDGTPPREAIRRLVDARRLAEVPSAPPGEAAGLLRRADRHIARAAAAAGADAGNALAAAWLASRYAVLAVLRVEGLDLRDTASATVAACARAVLPGTAGDAAAALEDAAARGDASDPAAHVAHARRVRAAADDHLGRPWP